MYRWNWMSVPGTVARPPNGIRPNAPMAQNSEMNGASRYSRGRAPSGIIVLLAQQLAEVGDRLQEPLRADAVRAVARLEAPDQPALDPGHDGEEAHQQVDERERLDRRDVEARRPSAACSTSASPVRRARRVQLMRTAPARSRREVRSGPVWSPPAWRTVTASCSDTPSRAASAWLSITHGARWCASARRALDGDARDERPRRDQREAARARPAPARPRAGARGAAASRRAARAGSGARPFSSLQVSGMPSSAASWRVRPSTRARRDLDAEVPGDRDVGRQVGHAAGRLRRPAAGAGCVPRGSWSCPRARGRPPAAARGGSSETDVFTNGETVVSTWRSCDSAICQRSASGHSAVGSTPMQHQRLHGAGLDRRQHLVAAAGEPARRAPRSFGAGRQGQHAAPLVQAERVRGRGDRGHVDARR